MTSVSAQWVLNFPVIFRDLFQVHSPPALCWSVPVYVEAYIYFFNGNIVSAPFQVPKVVGSRHTKLSYWKIPMREQRPAYKIVSWAQVKSYVLKP